MMRSLFFPPLLTWLLLMLWAFDFKSVRFDPALLFSFWDDPTFTFIFWFTSILLIRMFGLKHYVNGLLGLLHNAETNSETNAQAERFKNFYRWAAIISGAASLMSWSTNVYLANVYESVDVSRHAVFDSISNLSLVYGALFLLISLYGYCGANAKD